MSHPREALDAYTGGMLALSIVLCVSVTRGGTGAAPAPDTAATTWMARAATAAGLGAAPGTILKLVESTTSVLTDQSDRTYEPYVRQPAVDTVWLDPTTGVERVVDRRSTYIRAERATFRITDAGASADPLAHGRSWSSRAFDPWIVLIEWARAPDVRVTGHRRYRDYQQVLLTRAGRFGTDTLYLDARTALPTRLARGEAHYFLGPIHVGYVYATWLDIDRGALYPSSVTRLVDDHIAESRFIDPFDGGAALLPRDERLRIAVPDSTVTLAIEPQERFPRDPPDTVAVGGGTYLLASHVFTSVVSLQSDTVFVLDATAGEWRAEQDRAWVERLFPGRHPVVLIAMNAVWPHIAGMRYWVAHGATVVAARPIVPYLRSVLARRWTAMPDTLERARAHVTPLVRAVDDSAQLAGGHVRLYPMEGLNGETMLLGFIAPSGFVWASDHIQDPSKSNVYVEDVRATVMRHALKPASTSGPHFRVIPWAAIDSLPHVAAGPVAAPHAAVVDPAATVDEFLAAISGPAGQRRDRARIHGLLHPSARYWILAADSAGHPRAITVDPHAALDEAIPGWEARGFFERCVFHRTETWAGMAHVLCTYEIRRDPAGPVVVRGIDSAQLAFDGDRWQILSLYFHSESPTERVPADYGGAPGM